MSRFFIFLVIHGFLIVTLSSGIVKSIGPIIKDSSLAPSLLANKLPAASTFFLTYFLITGLTGGAGSLLQIVPLVIYYVKLYILGSTPRAVYGIKFGMVRRIYSTPLSSFHCGVFIDRRYLLSFCRVVSNGVLSSLI